MSILAAGPMFLWISESTIYQGICITVTAKWCILPDKPWQNPWSQEPTFHTALNNSKPASNILRFLLNIQLSCQHDDLVQYWNIFQEYFYEPFFVPQSLWWHVWPVCILMRWKCYWIDTNTTCKVFASISKPNKRKFS